MPRDAGASSGQAHFHGIDLLRFLAAMFVLLHHFATYSALRPEIVFDPSERAYGFLHLFENVGATGVEIFFVISGFVIAMSARSLSGWAGARRFALARARRILPALWLSASISFLALLVAGQDFASLVGSLLRSALLSPVGPYVDGVVWSLVVEAVFYLLIALAIATTRPLPLVKLALALGGASALYLAVLLAATLRGEADLAALLNRFPFKVLLLRYGVFFAAGMLLWHVMTQGRRAATVLAILVFGLFGMVEIALENWANSAQAAGSVVLWLASMAFLAGAIRWNHRIRPSPTLRLLGDMSYTIYLNHHTAGFVLTYLLYRAGVPGPASFAIALTAVLAASYLVLRGEKTIRRVLRGAGHAAGKPAAA